MGRWSDLPVDLLISVEECLVLYADKLRIRAVCLFWHQQLPKMPNSRFPCLLQAVDDNIEATHTLFNPIDEKFFFLDSTNLLQGKIFKGSAFGWVVTLEDVYDGNNSNRISIVNPLTSARIELPSRDKFPDVMKYQPYRVNEEYSVFSSDEGDEKFNRFHSSKDMTDDLTEKFVMSCDPSRREGEECVVAVIYGPYSGVACCTLKNEIWNPLNAIQDTFDDILFSKGKLHGLVNQGKKSQVLAFEDIIGIKPNPKITLVANHVHDPSYNINRDPKYCHTIIEEYLVESSDGSSLMIVERYIRFIENERIKVPESCNFKVYRVDPINRTSVELKSIGDDILVVGFNASMSISSHNCLGYKRNHIYFTDSKYSYYRSYIRLEDNDIGVFNLEDGTLQSLCSFKSNPNFLWPPPIWVKS